MPELDSVWLAQVGCGPAREEMACSVSLLRHLNGGEVTTCRLDRALTASPNPHAFTGGSDDQLHRALSLPSVAPCVFLRYAVWPFGFPQADSGGFSSASDGKESACNVGAAGGAGSIPGLGRSPGEGNGNPL